MAEARASTNPTDANIDLASVPDVYALTGVGNCMEPLVSDGATLAFRKSLRPKAGDLVCVWFRPGARPDAPYDRWLKRLVIPLPDGALPSDEAPATDAFPWAALGNPLCVIEQLNPPRQYMISAGDLLAIHVCLGEAVSNGEGMATIDARLLERANEGAGQ